MDIIQMQQVNEHPALIAAIENLTSKGVPGSLISSTVNGYLISVLPNTPTSLIVEGVTTCLLAQAKVWIKNSKPRRGFFIWLKRIFVGKPSTDVA